MTAPDIAQRIAGGEDDGTEFKRGIGDLKPVGRELCGYILTEERTIEAAGPGALDPEAFRDFLRAQGIEVDAEPQPPLEDDYLNRGAVRRVLGQAQATLYGVLAFGREPQRYPQTRNFFVACAAYAGRDRGDEVILVGDAKGRLDEQVARALGWTKALGHGERYHGLLREDVPLIPEAVLREALVNAVVHRDYAITGSKVLLEVFADRVVVTNPGALPNHMSVAAVRAGGLPRSRNEWLAHFMLVRRQMEQRGRGFVLMCRRMREFNGSEPLLEVFEAERFVRLTLDLRPPAA